MFPQHFSVFTKATLLAAMALCPTALFGAVTQPVTGAACNAPKLMVASTTNQQTDIGAPRELARFSFTSTQAGCVLLNFSGEVLPGSAGALFMTAKLDAVVGPNVEVIANTNETETRPAAFVFTNVPAGSHLLRLFFFSNNTGETVLVGKSVIWVHHP